MPHNRPLGLSAKTTAGVDMGINREPGGTLNSMRTGGETYFYLTDTIGSVIGLADEDDHIDCFPQPDPPARNRTPTATQLAAPQLPQEPRPVLAHQSVRALLDAPHILRNFQKPLSRELR